MLDALELRAIELLATGEHTKTNIAKVCNKSRQWLWELECSENGKAELNKRLQQVQMFGENMLKATVQDRLNDIIVLAKTAESEKIRLEANVYLANRVYGNPSSRLDITATTKQQEQVDFDAELDDIVNMDDSE